MNSKALFGLTYGLYVITAKSGEKRNGQIANTVFQITSNPITIATCINKQNFTHSLIKESGRFGISILEKDTPMEIIGLFGFHSGKDIDKFADVKYTDAAGGSPVLTEDCIGYLECDIKKEIDFGTHTMFIGELSDAEVLKQGDPLTYAYYHEVKKGTTPKSAPTYHDPEGKPSSATQNAVSGKLYRCPVCGYVYDPSVGDPEHDIKPGTAFEDLPADWRCPICKASKIQFVEE